MTKPVTFASFLDQLAITQDQGWKVLSNGFIRNKNHECPACALASAIGLNQDRQKAWPPNAWNLKKLPDSKLDSVMERIMNAADLFESNDRAALCLALNIKDIQ